jgi:hypothetical protein
MDWLSRSDVILLSIAVYVAVMTLVRLMRVRRDQLVADVQRQVESHRNKRHRHAEREDSSAA